jgi:hypothetical protein
MHDVRYALREPEVALEGFDGEAILIDFRTGSYYSLSPSASEIVAGLGARWTPAEVITALGRRYPLAADRVEQDVLGLTQRFVEEGVLVAGPAPADVPAASGEPPWGPAAARYEAPVVERYEDMQEMLLLDPIHDVDLTGWPAQRPADEPPA